MVDAEESAVLWSAATDGFAAWRASPATPINITGGVTRKLTSDDEITDGEVTVGVAYRLSSSGSRELFADSTKNARLTVVNLGNPDLNP